MPLFEYLAKILTHFTSFFLLAKSQSLLLLIYFIAPCLSWLMTDFPLLRFTVNFGNPLCRQRFQSQLNNRLLPSHPLGFASLSLRWMGQFWALATSLIAAKPLTHCKDEAAKLPFLSRSFFLGRELLSINFWPLSLRKCPSLRKTWSFLGQSRFPVPAKGFRWPGPQRIHTHRSGF